MPDLPIDRQSLVDRHQVVLREADPRSPLTVGNGEFCFTADLTGLQTFPDHYPVGPRDPGAVDGTLLGTMSQWGWHSTPTSESYVIDDSMITYETPRGPVRYVDQTGSVSGGTERDTNERDLWLRANPHRLHLGLIGLARTDRGDDGDEIRPEDLQDAEQRLDAWRGELRSRFTLAGHAVSVITVCDPDRDLVAVRIESPALAAGLIMIRLDFPYGSEDWHRSADWTADDHHRTEVDPVEEGWIVRRTVDDTTYQLRLATSPGADLRRTGPHSLRLQPAGEGVFEVRAWFSREVAPVPPAVADVTERAARWWAGFWSGGAAVQLSGTDDPRAVELERRIVLSQYLTAVSAGSAPPAETGLICNSWRGKFHLEMHWWHSAHFALWNRPELLLRSLRWYHDAPAGGPGDRRRAGLPRRPVAEAGRSGRARGAELDRAVPGLAAAASDLPGRAGLSFRRGSGVADRSRGRSGGAGGVRRHRLRQRRLHGRSGRADRPRLRARPAADPGPGELRRDPDRGAEPDLRARLLALGARRRLPLAGAARAAGAAGLAGGL